MTLFIHTLCSSCFVYQMRKTALRLLLLLMMLLLLLCVWCVCLDGGREVRVYVESPEADIRCLYHSLPTLFFETESLILNLELTDSTTLMDQKAPGSFCSHHPTLLPLSLPHPHTQYSAGITCIMHAPPHLLFFLFKVLGY